MTVRKSIAIAVALAFVLSVLVLISAPGARGLAACAKGDHASPVPFLHRPDADRPVLGVEVQELNPGLREALDLGELDGVLVARVHEDGPAEKAGIKAGDVILEIDGKGTPDYGRLVSRLRKYDPGDEVEVLVWRDGKKKTFKVKLEKSEELGEYDFPEPEFLAGVPFAAFRGRAFLGVTTVDLNDELAEYFHVDAGSGALVTQVAHDSPAAEAGIKSGDIITKLAGEDISGPSDLAEAVADHDPGEEVEIALIRKGKAKTIRAELGKRSFPGVFSLEKLGAKERDMRRLMRRSLSQEALEENLHRIERRIKKLQKSLEKLERRLEETTGKN